MTTTSRDERCRGSSSEGNRGELRLEGGTTGGASLPPTSRTRSRRARDWARYHYCIR